MCLSTLPGRQSLPLHLQITDANGFPRMALVPSLLVAHCRLLPELRCLCDMTRCLLLSLSVKHCAFFKVPLSPRRPQVVLRPMHELPDIEVEDAFPRVGLHWPSILKESSQDPRPCLIAHRLCGCWPNLIPPGTDGSGSVRQSSGVSTKQQLQEPCQACCVLALLIHKLSSH